MPLFPLQFPPGLYRNGTELQARGRWINANLVRFFDGTIRPIGGWLAKTSGTLTGIGRSMQVWRDDSKTVWAAVGTASKLYAMSIPGTVMSDITPAGFTAGNTDATAALGYGDGYYGNGGYGVGQASSIITFATTWSLDNWGQYLVGCTPDDGKIYQWTLDTGTKAVQVTNSPLANAVVVTDQRILMALGAGGVQRRVKWSDQGDNTSWTPLTTNQAGSFDLTTSGQLIQGKRFRGQVLLLTDIDAHLATYTGDVFVYGFQKIGNGCGAISANCMASTGDFIVWMSPGEFFIYNGYLEKLPCDVSDYLFTNMNMGQASKVSTFVNSAWSEITWYFPMSTENDSYVTWNYRERHWTMGSLKRGCGSDKGPMPYPLHVGTDGYVYEHEEGYAYADSGAAAQVPFLESGPTELGNGDNVLYATQLVPDELTLGDVSVTFKTKFYPNGAETSYGPYTLSAPTDVRFPGRQIRLRYDAVKSDSWRVGVPKLEVRVGGMR